MTWWMHGICMRCRPLGGTCHLGCSCPRGDRGGFGLGLFSNPDISQIRMLDTLISTCTFPCAD